MKLIVGLGNPGPKYENTRHNVGFMVIDQLSKKFSIPLAETKFKGIYGYKVVNGEKLFLLKPLIYMNLSGESMKPLMDYYKISVEDIVVIYDDLDLPVGKIRLRQKGSHGGHNGIRSIIAHLGTSDFNRIRVGIDRPEKGMSISNYVLANFGKEEMLEMERAIERTSEACERWLEKDFLQVMNEFN